MRTQLLTAAGFAALATFAANKGDEKGADTTAAPEAGGNSEATGGDVIGTEPTQEGIRARRAVMLKQFIPGENIDWIMKNVVAGGAKTRATLGRVFGICTGYELKHGTLPDGTPSTSIALKGAFQTESYVDGEVGECTLAFLPAAYGEKLKAIFDANALTNSAGDVIGNNVKMIEVDVDVGVEATGKTIPYEWVITAFREGAEMAVLKRMRQSRARPAFVLKTGEGSDAKVIEAKARPVLPAIPMLEAPAAEETAPAAS
jgi:hypothetical protein